MFNQIIKFTIKKKFRKEDSYCWLKVQDEKYDLKILNKKIKNVKKNPVQN